jgi:hypothetical protein
MKGFTRLMATGIMVLLVLTSMKVRAGTFSFTAYSPSIQIKIWRQVNKSCNFGISEEAFMKIPNAPELTEKDKLDGFVFVALFYGFGDDGKGNANLQESGEKSWEMVKQIYDDAKPDRPQFKEKRLRLRPGAEPRPQGFYWKKVLFGTGDYQGKSVDDARKMFPKGDTGGSFEGIQLAHNISAYFMAVMNGKDKPYIDLADYDVVSPYGDSDVSESPYLSYMVGYKRLIFDYGLANYTQPSFGVLVLR